MRAWRRDGAERREKNACRFLVPGERSERGVSASERPGACVVVVRAWWCVELGYSCVVRESGCDRCTPGSMRACDRCTPGSVRVRSLHSWRVGESDSWRVVSREVARARLGFPDRQVRPDGEWPGTGGGWRKAARCWENADSFEKEENCGNVLCCGVLLLGAWRGMAGRAGAGRRGGVGGVVDGCVGGGYVCGWRVWGGQRGRRRM